MKDEGYDFSFKDDLYDFSSKDVMKYTTEVDFNMV